VAALPGGEPFVRFVEKPAPQHFDQFGTFPGRVLGRALRRMDVQKSRATVARRWTR